jgi:DNA-binding MurR/RpiR family transcriptional regulator
MNTTVQSFDRLRERLHADYESLSPHLKRIAQFALDDPNSFALETVAGIAETTGVQPSTLVRFAKTFGFTGFSDMQRVFRVRLIEGAPSYRDKVFKESRDFEQSARDNPHAILDEFVEASTLSLDQLRQNTSNESLLAAMAMVETARDVYVIGVRRAFPVAAYISYGLTRLEFRCHLLDYVGGMVPQQVVTMTPDDLLIAVSYAEYAPQVVEVVQDVFIREIPTLTITDTLSSPLTRYAHLYFTVNDSAVHRFRPLTASMALVQTLLIALGYRKDTQRSKAKRPAKRSAKRQTAR